MALLGQQNNYKVPCSFMTSSALWCTHTQKKQIFFLKGGFKCMFVSFHSEHGDCEPHSLQNGLDHEHRNCPGYVCSFFELSEQICCVHHPYILFYFKGANGSCLAIEFPLTRTVVNCYGNSEIIVAFCFPALHRSYNPAGSDQQQHPLSRH